MRVAPSPEQWAYLQSIGALSAPPVAESTPAVPSARPVGRATGVPSCASGGGARGEFIEALLRHRHHVVTTVLTIAGVAAVYWLFSSL